MKPASKATAKYQEKIGMIAKTYKLRKEVVESFKAACEAKGVSQAAALTEFMSQYPDMKPKIVYVTKPCRCWWCRLWK
jgi:hypothetical protein